MLKTDLYSAIKSEDSEALGIVCRGWLPNARNQLRKESYFTFAFIMQRRRPGFHGGRLQSGEGRCCSPSQCF